MGRITRSLWRFFRWKGTEYLTTILLAAGVLSAFFGTAVIAAEIFSNKASTKLDELELGTKALLAGFLLTLGLSLGAIFAMGRGLAVMLPHEWLDGDTVGESGDDRDSMESS